MRRAQSTNRWRFAGGSAILKRRISLVATDVFDMFGMVLLAVAPGNCDCACVSVGVWWSRCERTVVRRGETIGGSG
jgi:hypothetical protein